MLHCERCRVTAMRVYTFSEVDTEKQNDCFGDKTQLHLRKTRWPNAIDLDMMEFILLFFFKYDFSTFLGGGYSICSACVRCGSLLG